MNKKDLVEFKDTGIIGKVESVTDSLIVVRLPSGSKIIAPKKFFNKKLSLMEKTIYDNESA